jgi:hypothetical protein
MDEHDPQAPTVDTPATDTPQGTGTDWEERYKEAQSWGTKAAQEAAQLKAQLSDPEYQAQLMAQWGYEVEQPEPEQGWVDPTDELRQQLTELQEWKNAQEQQRQQQQQLDQITQSVAQQFQTAAPDLDEPTREWVTTRALNMDPREDGMPDITGALNDYNAWVQEQQKQWEESRRRPRPPHVPPGGQAASSAPDLTDRQARRQHMAEQLAATQADQ